MDSDTSTSDDEIGGIKKWMPVEIPKDFDPNKIPSNGEEYLHYAIYEARNCQSTVTADIDTTKFNKKPTISFNPLVDCAKCSESFLPTQAWQKQIVADYTEFRDYVMTKLPRRLPEGENQAHLKWIEKMDHEYPKMSEITSLNTCTQVALLELIIKKLKQIQPGHSIIDSMGAWIHGILSVIQTPLSPSMCSVIRTLARKCALIRSKLPDDAGRQQYRHLNYFICIISLYFKQFDLADHTD